VDDAAAAPQVLGKLEQASFPRLAKLWADNKYHNHELNRWVSENGWYVIEVISRPPGSGKFELVKYRWVVERTFAWLGRCRIHSRDYERLTPISAEGNSSILVRMSQALVQTNVNLTGRFPSHGIGTGSWSRAASRSTGL